MYVAGALLLSGPLTPHQIHHIQHIWLLAGAVAPHCSRLISNHLQLCYQGAIWTPTPGFCPGPFQHVGCRGRRPNCQLSAHPATSGRIHQNWCSIYYVCKNVLTFLYWGSTAHHSCSFFWINLNVVGFTVGRNIRHYDCYNITINITLFFLYNCKSSRIKKQNQKKKKNETFIDPTVRMYT